jgi:hypothetical protein
MTRRRTQRPTFSWTNLFGTVVAAILSKPKALADYLDQVEAGADPIEALHGHICSVDCWHRQHLHQECPTCPHKSLDHGPGGCKIAGCPCQKVPASATR